MKYKSRLLELAKSDLKETARWYNQQESGLGKRFIVEAWSKIAKITLDPMIFAVKFNETRAALLDTFPYLIFYEIFADQKLVIISAILSSHRNPEVIKRRIV